MSTKFPFIRLAPVQFEDLPPHPSFPPPSTKQSQPRPDLLTFTLTTLDQGRSLLLPTNFNLTFKNHSWKPSPPSNNEVEILSTELSTSILTSSIPWSTPAVPRSKPLKIRDEYWYARRSHHHNLSVKRNAPGTASFNEFIFGLRDHKSVREAQFTSDLYDARYICDWNDELASLLTSFNSNTSSSSYSTHQQPQRDPTNSPTYTHPTISIYEMCHKLPAPASPRCFPVLVLTASVSAHEFISVTLPVDISHLPTSFYSSSRNTREATDHQSRKQVTIANHVAVERVCKYPSTSISTSTSASASEKEKEKDRGGKPEKNEGKESEEIEWVMATASHAKGNIPVAVQRMGVPGAIAKDVGLFLKWIRDVPEGEVAGVSNWGDEDGGGGGVGGGVGV